MTDLLILNGYRCKLKWGVWRTPKQSVSLNAMMAGKSEYDYYLTLRDATPRSYRIKPPKVSKLEGELVYECETVDGKL